MIKPYRWRIPWTWKITNKSYNLQNHQNQEKFTAAVNKAIKQLTQWSVLRWALMFVKKSSQEERLIYWTMLPPSVSNHWSFWLFICLKILLLLENKITINDVFPFVPLQKQIACIKLILLLANKLRIKWSELI